MQKELNITLDGKIVKALQGETILQVANRNSIEIPTLCHDPRLEPYSSCFVCVVEIEGMRGMQTSCSTRVNEGMVIHTQNEKVRKARKTALDLLLSNHYADCQAPCKDTCPAGVDVQGYISLIDKGMYEAATALIKKVNPLPAICGRVCVRPCEVACRRNLLDEGAPVGIDYMKRFAADYDLFSANHYVPKCAPKTGKKVAIIGAGPGGISTAYFLQQKGHQCDIYEASPYAGGMLRYGIPEYRLPNELIDREVNCVTEIGANLFVNQKLGDNLSYKTLRENYDSVVLTIGSQGGSRAGVAGDDAEGVLSGIDFLRNMEMTGQRYDFSGKTVAVIGGGNTAMDCCRSSMRCGAEKTYIIYRRTEAEMPANPIEIHESKLENVEYLFLTNPTQINKDENGRLKSVTLIKMDLGEPDASGRRRPMPVEGSEFELELDYILAAIGQKTTVNFLEDINTHETNGQLVVNRWGNIDADAKTLQTGIASVFAAGDGVTGPATLIEAVAQAKIAARSVDQFLNGQTLAASPKEFLSKKNNFKTQVSADYVNKFGRQSRIEMPVLAPVERFNFNEVELGYDEPSVRKEAQRCMECGCTEYYGCDLKKYATEYDAVQQKFAGDFKQFQVDFSHPFIEIDNNKCILCSRCIRICKDVVGANALGLVNRGFDTYVAPSMGKSLNDTNCESCGLCISTCPTGAITENVTFKPGPVPLQTYDTICTYCSVGCTVRVHHHEGYVMRISGAAGLINSDCNICRDPKFAYSYFNDKHRITQPLLKKDGQFVAISYEEAAALAVEKIKKAKAGESAFFAGARLTNEEIYVIDKLAQQTPTKSYLGSFAYLGQPDWAFASEQNVPLEQIKEASRIYLLGTDLNVEHGVVGFMASNARETKGVPIEILTTLPESTMEHKADHVVRVESYYHFVRAANHYLLRKGLQNQFFIDGKVAGFEAYKEALLKEDYEELVHKAIPCCRGSVVHFANQYNDDQQAVLIFSENQVSAATARELYNLALITGKLGKTASGLICLRTGANAQGLLDAVPQNDALLSQLASGNIKNIVSFGEDPIGCAKDKSEVAKWFESADFVLASDYFMTETLAQADLILPASFASEIGGSFTNTQRMLQLVEANAVSKLEISSFSFMAQLLKQLGGVAINSVEACSDLAVKAMVKPSQPLAFIATTADSEMPRFHTAADSLIVYKNNELTAREK